MTKQELEQQLKTLKDNFDRWYHTERLMLMNRISRLEIQASFIKTELKFKEETTKHKTINRRGDKKKYCAGCYCDDYNSGLGGAKECWFFTTAKLKMRKRVHASQVPPWKQKPEKMLSCYNKPQYMFFDGDREC